jgi:deoxyxylulose-5-phosphate synthase
MSLYVRTRFLSWFANVMQPLASSRRLVVSSAEFDCSWLVFPTIGRTYHLPFDGLNYPEITTLMNIVKAGILRFVLSGCEMLGLVLLAFAI